MIEKDLAHLRFLYVRCLKGDRLFSEDIDFIQKMKEKIKLIQESIDEISERLEND